MKRTFLVLGVVLAMAPALPASAQPLCTSLPHAVIGSGGSASKPLIARLATQLAGSTSPLTLIYQSLGACYAITPYVDGTNITGTASYWTAAGTEQSCSLGTLGVSPDFGMTGTEGTLCSGVTAIPAGIGEFSGPVTSWSVIVPIDSTQTTISAEALYFIYGFGAAGDVSPWNITSEIYGRNATSAAQIELGLAIGVPAARFMAINTLTNQGTVNALRDSPNHEAAIGFTSTEVTETGTNPTLVRTLAYQHYGQTCGYWPSSTATAFDRRNIRDGHYYLWSQYRFYVPVGASGAITDADTATLIGYFTGSVTPPADVALLDTIIENGNIPECAMNVWRDSDLGPLYSYVPPVSCGCYFESVATGSAPSSCTSCTSDAGCTSGSATHCRYGFCEVS